MSACQEWEEQLTLLAAGALEPEVEGRLREHVASCEGCRRELESTTRVLSDLALPPASPALRERMETLPRRVVGAWQREQVRKVSRARTLSAILAVAAAVLLVVGPPFPWLGVPSPLRSASAPPSLSETQSDFEQWAVADPLGDMLASASAEEDLSDGEDALDGESPPSELWLNLNAGESL
jgi:anti-sigma factor RsiW